MDKNLSPGRELDALVAEKAMGWARNRGSGVGFTTPDGEYRSIDIWSPSTDIAAAWQVVGKLRERGFGFSLNDAWIAWFLAAPNEYQASADTAPHAICLAALRAVGAEV